MLVSFHRMLALEKCQSILLVLIATGEKYSMNNRITKLFFNFKKIYYILYIYLFYISTVPNALLAGKANKH